MKQILNDKSILKRKLIEIKEEYDEEIVLAKKIKLEPDFDIKFEDERYDFKPAFTESPELKLKDKWDIIEIFNNLNGNPVFSESWSQIQSNLVQSIEIQNPKVNDMTSKHFLF